MPVITSRPKPTPHQVRSRTWSINQDPPYTDPTWVNGETRDPTWEEMKEFGYTDEQLDEFGYKHEGEA